jgi:NAD(P)-dependent dehydrogenase (short-subunit alcohol dehydrogenase family)
VGVLDRDASAAALVADELGERAVALTADTTAEHEVDAALDRFADATGLPAPHGLVANAGVVRFGPLATVAIEDWRTVVDVNLTGTFITARAAARRMIDAATGGSLVMVTSMNGVVPGPNAGAYGATKAGVALLTQQMAVEWGPAGIRANAVAPGLIDGGMSAPIYADPAIREQRAARVPLGRLGATEDVADAVLFLLSDHAGYISGTELLVDGGVTPSIISTLPRPRAVDTVGPTEDA